MRDGEGRMEYKSTNNHNQPSSSSSSFCDDVYQGEWKQDERHGLGTMRLLIKIKLIFHLYFIFIVRFGESGNVYEGNWISDLRTGSGKYFYSSTNRVYEGEWIDDKPHCGEYRWS